MKRYFIVIAMLMLASTKVAAQSRPAACGSLSEEIASVNSVARYFTADEFEEVRTGHISQVAPTDSQYIVTDSTTCQTLHEEAIQQLQSQPNNAFDVQRTGHDFTVFRIGPYYAVVLVEKRPIDPQNFVVRSNDSSPVVVFAASGLTYIFSFGI